MPEYNEKWRYVTLRWKILILEVAGSCHHTNDK